jgi:hypothetical protein
MVSQTKSMEYCLDRVLNSMYHSWKPDGTRAFLNVEELLSEFGLPKRHEYFIALVDKLVKDGNAMLTDRDQGDYTLIDYYARRSLITIDGHLFVEKGRTYQAQRKWSRFKSFCKDWLPLIFTVITITWTISWAVWIARKSDAAIKSAQRSVNTVPAVKQDTARSQ